MKRDFGVKPYLFPMPVLMIATYGDDGSVDVMNMAWGGICASDKVSLNIDEEHKTSENIKKRGAFTIAVADVKHLKEADFLGIASGNTMPDKFERTGLTAVKSEKVDAPVVEEFPVTLECRLSEIKNESYGFHIVGEIVGTLVDESVLDENGKVDVSKLGAFAYDEFTNSYWGITTKVGKAFSDGTPLMKKEGESNMASGGKGDFDVYDVDQDTCIGCGMCEATCPAVFRMNDEGKAEAYAPASQDDLSLASEALEGCPVAAIKRE